MVASTDCADKAKPISGNKVSKPVMEKKRRARINQCLDQLKSLLETYYSSSIRKRKLEKADILELTVKHMKSLQRMQSYTNAASEVSDYQQGFSSCLDNFNHYLLMSDSLSMSDHWMLSQLSNRLCRSQRRAGPHSTSDSGASHTHARNGAQQAVTAAAAAAATEEKESESSKPEAHRLHSVNRCDSKRSEDTRAASRTDGNRNDQLHTSVWRPW